jgi:hypothetical protein
MFRTEGVRLNVMAKAKRVVKVFINIDQVLVSALASTRCICLDDDVDGRSRVMDEEQERPIMESVLANRARETPLVARDFLSPPNHQHRR